MPLWQSSSKKTGKCARGMLARDARAPAITKLRKQLLEVQQELTEAINDKVRKQSEGLRGTRLTMQDLTRQEASVCLNLRRANTRLTEARNAIDSQEEQIRRREFALAERRAAPAEDKSASSSAMVGGVDPAGKQVRLQRVSHMSQEYYNKLADYLHQR